MECKIVLETDSMTFRPNLHLCPLVEAARVLFVLAVFCAGRLLRGFENQPVQTCLQNLMEVKW